MDSSNLKFLLHQYDQQRIKNQEDLEERKKEIYSKNPRLEQIDAELFSAAISANKILLTSRDMKALDSFKKKSEELKKERNNIFKELNISSDYLTIHYKCTKCKDTGYIINNDSTIMCNCLKQKLFDLEYNKANITNLTDYNFDKFSLDLYSNEVNPQKYNSDISPRDNMKIIKKICENFINNYDDNTSKNLLFTGNTGLGKTFLSNCIANEILKKEKTVLYQTAPVMLDSIIDARFNKANSSKDLINNILNVDLLIIDDLGAENINSLKLAELFNIINSRIIGQTNKKLKTIISTNLNFNNIKNNYDERITSRLIGEYDICRFYGDDIRFVKKFNSIHSKSKK